MIDQIVPPPCEVRRRAWEAAVDLLHERAGDLAARDRALCRAIAQRGPDDLAWRDCGWALRAHRALFPARAA
jgi:hypothetical protein